MKKKKISDSNPFQAIILSAILSLLLLPGCAPVGEVQPSPVYTETLQDLQPTPEITLAEQYLVLNMSAGGSLDLRSAPGREGEVSGTIPFGSTRLRPTGEVRQIDEQIWIEISWQAVTGWTALDDLAEQHGSLPEDLVILAHQTAYLLKSGDYAGLEPILHSELCLRFSPYAYLHPDNQILCPAELMALDDGSELLWGFADGTGDPIELGFWDYHDRFVYDEEYLQAPIVGLDHEVSSGNSINNIPEIYPDGKMVEYHFPEIDPQYGGLDWRSLRLVFVNLNGSWYLAAIVHSEWTI